MFRPIQRRRRRRGRKHSDPLAQSFTVDSKGAFLSSVDLYFASVDPSAKITVQVRPLQLIGTPTENLVVIHGEIALNHLKL